MYGTFYEPLLKNRTQPQISIYRLFLPPLIGAGFLPAGFTGGLPGFLGAGFLGAAFAGALGGGVVP